MFLNILLEKFSLIFIILLSINKLIIIYFMIKYTTYIILNKIFIFNKNIVYLIIFETLLDTDERFSR